MQSHFAEAENAVWKSQADCLNKVLLDHKKTTRGARSELIR
jgi:hypothetical protein